MHREELQSFVRTAEADLASVRSSLLIIAQTGDASDIGVLHAGLSHVRTEAQRISQPGIAGLASDCEAVLAGLGEDKNGTSHATYKALDLVAAIEAELLNIPIRSGDFLEDVSGFVDSSFAELLPRKKEAAVPETHDDEQFEIDDETLEIFRSEADELLANIGNAIGQLRASPGDQKALWEMRRNAHTFKGAAGIVGLTAASVVAHRMEDLLDKMVELRREAAPHVVDFLDASYCNLNDIVEAKTAGSSASLDEQYEKVMEWLSSREIAKEETPSEPPAAPAEKPEAAIRVEVVKPVSTPIVRVSLERLDELLRISHNLAINRAAVAEGFADFTSGVQSNIDPKSRLNALFEIGRRLAGEMQEKLLRIRMVKFGTLETRLSRAVHITSLDENKKATLVIEDPDVEIDTLVIDALIEPLLHLLKNAVVHGIESPETRRLIGKPEAGKIVIRLQADDDALVLATSDDGCGISIPKLKEKAVASRLIDKQTADAMPDHEAIKLVFDRGLTTAGKIDLNAGRGVGMSIVKESVGARGGRVVVESQPQRGTTFTILMPLSLSKSEPVVPTIEVRPVANQRLALVVDDSASIRRQTQMLVERAGLKAMIASNGAEAIELLCSGEYHPDLIISDIEMPQVDGWGLLEYVKTSVNFHHIPMVMVTSLDADHHKDRAFGLGASDYVIKPFSGKVLERILEKLEFTVAA